MPEIDVNRNSHLIDPHLDIWGWEIPFYLFLGGLVAGIMIFGALITRNHEGGSRWVRWAPFAAPILLSVGMLFLFLDLENKLRVYRFYLAFRPASPMSWGAWILLLIYPVTIGLGLVNLSRNEAEKLSNWFVFKKFFLGKLLLALRIVLLDRREHLRWTSVFLGALLGLYTGILLGTFEARPLWNTSLLAPLFLASGMSAGAAFMMLFPVKEEEHHKLRRWDLMAIGAEVTFLVLFFIDRGTSCAESGEQVMRFFGGDLTAAFWTLVVLAGLAVPVTLEIVEKRRKIPPTIVAPILILMGSLALRWIFVYAGQVNPMG